MMQSIECLLNKSKPESLQQQRTGSTNNDAEQTRIDNQVKFQSNSHYNRIARSSPNHCENVALAEPACPLRHQSTPKQIVHPFLAHQTIAVRGAELKTFRRCLPPAAAGQPKIAS
jgi:hypothetical protein